MELASGGLVFRIKELKELKEIDFSWQAKYFVGKKPNKIFLLFGKS